MSKKHLNCSTLWFVVGNVFSEYSPEYIGSCTNKILKLKKEAREKKNKFNMYNTSIFKKAQI